MGRTGFVRTTSCAVAAVMALTAAGCTTETDTVDSAEQRSDEVNPSVVIEQVADYAGPLIEEWGVPSVAIGLVTDEGLAEARFFGENTNGEPVDADTLFEIGSATKAFLGVTEALLVEEGAMSWDDPVQDHDPDFVLADPWVTREFRIIDLLAQRSGLAPYAADLLGHLGYPYEDAIGALQYAEPVTSFRSEFAYQNIPHLVAGRIVARHVGAPTWGDAASELIFEPLQMNSSLVAPDALASSTNTTAGHEVHNDAVRVLPAGRFPSEAQGAGGIVSNLEDMSKWVAMHLSGGDTPAGEFLPSEALEITYRPLVPVTGDFADGMKQGDGPPRTSYATGWLVHSLPEGRVIEHGGTTNGYTSSVRFDPDRGVGVVVLTNLAHQGGLATPIAQYTMDLIQGRDPVDYEQRVQQVLAARAEEAAGQDRVDPPDPTDLERFAGRYEHPVAGTVEVTLQGDELATVIGPRNVELSFDRTGENDFVLLWNFDNDPESWHLSAPATFVGDGDQPQQFIIGDLVFERLP